MFDESEVGLKNWYAIACCRGGWAIKRLTTRQASWLRSHKCEVDGPFPIRDIARLACGQRLSRRHHFVSTLHGDDLWFGLMGYGMRKWHAFNLARAVDERTAHERSAATI